MVQNIFQLAELPGRKSSYCIFSLMTPLCYAVKFWYGNAYGNENFMLCLYHMKELVWAFDADHVTEYSRRKHPNNCIL